MRHFHDVSASGRNRGERLGSGCRTLVYRRLRLRVSALAHHDARLRQIQGAKLFEQSRVLGWIFAGRGTVLGDDLPRSEKRVGRGEANCDALSHNCPTDHHNHRAAFYSYHCFRRRTRRRQTKEDGH